MRALILPLLLMSFTGCGAFADAAGEDGGNPDSKPSLLIEPNPFIQQGQVKEFVISFTRSPPWAEIDGAKGLLTGFDLGCDDVGYSTLDYPGQKTITAVLRAERSAVPGERILTITAAYERLGEEQVTHSEWNVYWVYERMNTDGGSQ